MTPNDSKYDLKVWPSFLNCVIHKPDCSQHIFFRRDQKQGETIKHFGQYANACELGRIKDSLTETDSYPFN